MRFIHPVFTRNSEVKQEVEIEPLTKMTIAGKPYTRRPEVEQQIREILPLARELLKERLKEADYSKPEYVKSECIANLVRHYWRLGDDDYVNDLTKVLTDRITGTIDRHISFVSPNRKDECRDEIVTSIIMPLINPKSNYADFAEI